MKTINALFPLLITLIISTAAQADTFKLGEPVPPAEIAKLGELLLNAEEEIEYGPWVLAHPEGKSHVINYMAGTVNASKLNEPFTDALQVEADLELFYITTIVNLDDALWGTGGFVRSEVEKNKRKFPESTLVLDKDGTAREQWQLDKKTSTIVITDPAGLVRYVKHGAMSESEIAEAIKLINSYGAAEDTEQ